MIELEDEIKKEGMGNIVESVREFIVKFKHYFVAVGSPKKFLQWISKAIPLSAFPGEIKSSKGGKSVRIPVTFVENPDQAYAQRWKKLLATSKRR